MARTVSKKSRKQCLRKMAKMEHKKAKTRRQHQLAVSKASRRCTNKKILSRRRRGVRRVAKPLKTIRPRDLVIKPEAYKMVYEEEGLAADNGVMTPEEYRMVYEKMPDEEIRSPEEYERIYNIAALEDKSGMTPEEYTKSYKEYFNVQDLSDCASIDTLRRRLYREAVRDAGGYSIFENSDMAKELNSAYLMKKERCERA